MNEQPGQIPTFEVTRRGRSLVFTCPRCGSENSHGACGPEVGAGNGHRVAHCRCWSGGYYIVEAEGKKERAARRPAD
jgi:hypothetical protein